MQKQARTIESLEGITAGVSFTTVAQNASGSATTDGSSESQWNYRTDVSVSLPGGEIGSAEGKLFAHFRISQGDGLRVSYHVRWRQRDRFPRPGSAARR
jgi:hypothetical protein